MSLDRQRRGESSKRNSREDARGRGEARGEGVGVGDDESRSLSIQRGLIGMCLIEDICETFYVYQGIQESVPKWDCQNNSFEICWFSTTICSQSDS